VIAWTLKRLRLVVWMKYAATEVRVLYLGG
jgi:hypothetical protein